MVVLEGLHYTENHEWVRVEGDIACIGITDYAQHELGEIVHVELPEVGENVNASEPLGTLEAVKTVEDVYSPVSGKVIKINSDLFDTPELINKSPYEEGWLIQVQLNDKDEVEKLLSSVDYQKVISD